MLSRGCFFLKRRAIIKWWWRRWRSGKQRGRRFDRPASVLLGGRAVAAHERAVVTSERRDAERDATRQPDQSDRDRRAVGHLGEIEGRVAAALAGRAVGDIAREHWRIRLPREAQGRVSEKGRNRKAGARACAARGADARVWRCRYVLGRFRVQSTAKWVGYEPRHKYV